MRTNVPSESGPERTLSPDELTAWSVIERSLRRDLPMHKIERRARLQADQTIVLAALGLVAGVALALLASSAPLVVAAIGMITAGACVGVILVRGVASLASGAHRHRLGQASSPRRFRR